MHKNIILTLISLLILGASPVIFASDVETEMFAKPAEPIKETLTEPKKVKEIPASNTQPNSDTHVDYRYCLDLKTNLEIAACRYKKQ